MKLVTRKALLLSVLKTRPVVSYTGRAQACAPMGKPCKSVQLAQKLFDIFLSIFQICFVYLFQCFLYVFFVFFGILFCFLCVLVCVLYFLPVFCMCLYVLYFVGATGSPFARAR